MLATELRSHAVVLYCVTGVVYERCQAVQWQTNCALIKTVWQRQQLLPGTTFICHTSFSLSNVGCCRQIPQRKEECTMPQVCRSSCTVYHWATSLIMYTRLWCFLLAIYWPAETLNQTQAQVLEKGRTTRGTSHRPDTVSPRTSSLGTFRWKHNWHLKTLFALFVLFCLFLLLLSVFWLAPLLLVHLFCKPYTILSNQKWTKYFFYFFFINCYGILLFLRERRVKSNTTRVVLIG